MTPNVGSEGTNDVSTKPTPESLVEALESQRKNLCDGCFFSTGHEQTLRKYADTRQAKRLPSATTRRRTEATRAFYTTLYNNCGSSPVILCLLTISNTRLLEIRDILLRLIIAWWEKAPKPQHLIAFLDQTWKDRKLGEFFNIEDSVEEANIIPQKRPFLALDNNEDLSLPEIDGQQLQSSLSTPPDNWSHPALVADIKNSLPGDRTGPKRFRHDIHDIHNVGSTVHDDNIDFAHQKTSEKEIGDVLTRLLSTDIPGHQPYGDSFVDSSPAVINDAPTYALTTIETINLLSSDLLAHVRIFMSVPVYAGQGLPLVHFAMPHEVAKDVIKKRPRIED
ncbi:hypothetical protein BKA56DRAFT_682153 [Ilyonectria sp. MPI-CAGE-AT-0026]|nr:hypothetical protein BKA56DRAFT_682153 [Ilyonectria sp. MPI-CAGE-AT-0026]